MSPSRGEMVMAKMRCGVAAVEALRVAGATTIFGLMGSSTLEIYDALYDAKDFTYTSAGTL
jgi:thiamine pyrophosphate-dependent acetolactate synthase large subunit-like protein